MAVSSVDPQRRRRGSVLLFVLWAMMLVTVAAYVVGHLTAVHVRTSAHRLGQQRAAELLASGTHLARHVLWSDRTADDFFNDNWAADESMAGLELDAGTIWIVGGEDAEVGGEDLRFGLSDESGKININTAGRATLLGLPNMTPELADNILTWRSGQVPVTGEADATEGEPEEGGGGDGYRVEGEGGPKGARFETIDELLDVPGMTHPILYGEDVNRNGLLDENENDGDASWPDDNRDGKLDRGLLAVATVYSRHTPTPEEKSKKDLNALDRKQLQDLLPDISEQVAQRIEEFRKANGKYESVAELIMIDGVTKENLRDWWPLLRVGEAKVQEGLVNVFTAPVAVLAALEPLDTEDAERIHDFVRGSYAQPEGLLWLLDLIEKDRFVAVVPLLTTRSERFSARIVAASKDGMYWARRHVVFNRSLEGEVTVLYVRDDTRNGPHLPESLLEGYTGSR